MLSRLSLTHNQQVKIVPENFDSHVEARLKVLTTAILSQDNDRPTMTW